MSPQAAVSFENQLESQLWRTFFDTAVDAVIVFDDTHAILAFNPAAEKLFGWQAHEMRGADINRLGTGEARYVRALFHFTGNRADGTQFPAEISVQEVWHGERRLFMASVRNNATGNPLVQQPIEPEVGYSEKRLPEAERIAKFGFWDWKVLTDELNWSDGMFPIFGVQKRNFKVAFSSTMEFVHPDDRFLIEEVVAKAIEEQSPFEVTHRIICPSGELRYVHTIGEIVVDEGSQFMMATTQDITERKIAEQAAQAALDQKDILLKEIHHRVKNNLQIIAGILTLQMSLVKDPATAEVLRSTEHRVRAMALVHERLYATNDLKHVDISVYLNELIDRLVVTLVPFPADVKVEKEFGSLMVDLDTAIPCGLIVSEFMTNSLKYGLNNGRGTIRTSLRREGGQIELRFQDEGPGLSGELDLAASPGLGLRLVQILAKQLRGTLQIKSDNGLQYVLSWTAKEIA